MTVFLNLMILLFGVAATAAAFEGKTYQQGDQPLLERITVRGWVSLLCLAAGLLFGGWKEVRTFQIAEHANRETDKQRAADNERRMKQEKLEALARAEEDKARAVQEEHFKGVQKLLEQEQEASGEYRRMLSAMHFQLADARSSLSTQSSANLLTLFATSNKQVVDATLHLFFTKEGLKSTSVPAALAGPLSDRCEQVSLTDVEIGGLETSYLGLLHYPSRINGADYGNNPQKATSIVRQVFSPEKVRTAEANRGLGFHQTSFNGWLYSAEVGGISYSAAEAYHMLLTQSGVPIVLVTDVPFEFPTSDSLNRFNLAHSELGGKVEGEFRRYPKVCADQVLGYYRRAYEYGWLDLSLDGSPSLTIRFTLKAGPARLDLGRPWLEFFAAGPPEVQATTFFKHQLDGKWADASLS